MLMTEEQAKEKWCPMVRVENNGVTVNDGMFTRTDGFSLGVGAVRCIGSKCAGWRRTGHQLYNGYCGFAGIPVAE